MEASDQASKMQGEKRGGISNLTNAGKGRLKGVPNKNTAALKDMILGALSDVGGRAYLAKQAEENPGPFMTLVGKVLPMTIAGTGADGAIVLTLTPQDAAL